MENDTISLRAIWFLALPKESKRTIVETLMLGYKGGNNSASQHLPFDTFHFQRKLLTWATWPTVNVTYHFFVHSNMQA